MSAHRPEGIAVDVLLAENRSVHLETEVCSLWHSVACIGGEVHEDLFDLDWIYSHAPQPLPGTKVLDFLTDQTRKSLGDVGRSPCCESTKRKARGCFRLNASSCRVSSAARRAREGEPLRRFRFRARKEQKNETVGVPAAAWPRFFQGSSVIQVRQKSALHPLQNFADRGKSSLFGRTSRTRSGAGAGCAAVNTEVASSLVTIGTCRDSCSFGRALCKPHQVGIPILKTAPVLGRSRTCTLETDVGERHRSLGVRSGCDFGG
jgi:hypothetical protein